jgi:predicted SAM-dependent methyltransferase
MKSIEIIKNKLIDRVLATNNEKLLKAIDNIFESTKEEEKVMFSSDQIEMLLMSEKDIEAGEIVSETELDNMDNEWLN